MIWIAVIAGSLGTYVAKLIGFVIPDTVLGRPVIRRIAGYLPVALLAALVAVQTFATGSALTIDARLAGLAVAIVALILRAPFLVVVLSAAVTAALLRAWGIAS